VRDLISVQEITGRAGIRPGERYAWYGPALIVTDHQGACGGGDLGDPTGFYFRETRHLSRLRLDINGNAPWLCALGGARQDELAFSYVHPELSGGGGGGTGAAGEELPRDPHGLPRRAMDLLARYRVGVHTLEIELTLTNRWAERAKLELGWDLDADYADLLEVQEGARQQKAPVEALRPSPGFAASARFPSGRW
jgi:hypothetical protein